MTATSEQVFVNGKIFTARDEEEFVSAFKVTDGKISWVALARGLARPLRLLPRPPHDRGLG